MFEAIRTTQLTQNNLEKILKVETIDLNKNPDSELYKALRRHRVKYYSRKAPHLLKASEQLRECSVDQKSLLFVVLSGKKILASLRITRRPFEFEAFFNSHYDFTPYDQYLEIGRLVTDPDLDPLVQALIVRYLLCVTGLRAFTEFGSKGLVAICRPFRKSLFCKFGLRHIADVHSQERKIHYYFLAASAEEILAQTTELQKNETLLRKRLNKSFGIQGETHAGNIQSA